MDFITNFIERLPTASTTELPLLRNEYETYLAGLNANERTQAIRQVEPVLGELTAESVNRLESAASAYLARPKRHEALSTPS